VQVKGIGSITLAMGLVNRELLRLGRACMR